MHAYHDEISLGPIKKDLSGYTVNTFLHDSRAAISVALLSIPQAIAYSLVAGLPPITGVFAIILGTSLAAFLGSSRQLIAGPTNVTTMLVQAACADILFKYYGNIFEPSRTVILLEIMAGLTFLIGAFQLVAGLFTFGRVLHFVSHAVVIGYIAGASVALGAEQLFNFFGVQAPSANVSLYQKLHYFFAHLHEAKYLTALVGLGSLALLLLLKRLFPKVPAPLVMLVIVTFVVHSFGFDQPQEGNGEVIAIMGKASDIDTIIPSLQLPLFDLGILNGILPVAFAISLIGMLEATTIAKALATRSGQHVSSNQEIAGLGCANVALSCFGALPCSGSISRSVMNAEHGARTRFSGVFSGIFAAVFIAILGPLVRYLPLAALAAVILATAARMVDTKQLKLCLRATHSDAVVFVITFLSCLFFTLPLAFYIGIVLSIVLYLRKAAIPQIVEYAYNEDTQELRPMIEAERGIPHTVRIVNVEGELFFGAVDLFQGALKTVAEDDTSTRVLIVRLKHVRDIDATAALALKHLHDYLHRSGRHLVVTGISPRVWEVLQNAQLIQYLGRGNLFPLDERNPHRSIEEAIDRANAIVLHDVQPLPIVPAPSPLEQEAASPPSASGRQQHLLSRYMKLFGSRLFLLFM